VASQVGAVKVTALQPPAQKRTEAAILREIFGRGGCVDQLNGILGLQADQRGEPIPRGPHNPPLPTVSGRSRADKTR
jgi:hypothetical protein